MSVSDSAARTLANATKTVPQMGSITPRWLVHLMSWVPVEAGIYRVNMVVHPESVRIECDNFDESPLPDTFVDYSQEPREYRLKAVQTVLDLHTRISDLYSSPHNQTAQQLRLTIEAVKEHQEGELINSPEYGMLSSVSDSQRISTLAGAADAGRPGPPHHEGVEAAGLLPHPSGGDRRVRPGVHPARCAAGDGEHVRLTVPDLARPADHSVGQGPAGERQDEVPAAAHR